MGDVTVVGSITPCTELARGQYWTGPYTDHVQRLINLGVVEVVEFHEPQDRLGAALEFTAADGVGITAAGIEADHEQAEPEPVVEAVSREDDGEDGADSGQPNPKRVATKRAAKSSAVDETSETPA